MSPLLVSKAQGLVGRVSLTGLKIETSTSYSRLGPKTESAPNHALPAEHGLHAQHPQQSLTVCPLLAMSGSGPQHHIPPTTQACMSGAAPGGAANDSSGGAAGACCRGLALASAAPLNILWGLAPIIAFSASRFTRHEWFKWVG